MVWGLIAGAAIQGAGAQNQAQASREGLESNLYFKNLSLDEQQRQFDLQDQLLSPFYESGAQSLQGLERGAEGVSISQLLQQPAFQQLAQESMNDASKYVGAMGGRRSGYGQNQIASAGTNALKNIENLLNQRQQSLTGQSQTTGFQLGSQGAQTTGNISNLLQAQGAASMQNALRQGNIQTQLAQNLTDLGVSAVDYYR